ncbi:MAG: copper amine oxidase N-terminal domain-containing protein [Oscillospiraceae bacterium]|nr:copper amine oxidase N-terminal domain-containing protein [Oscillospiraceae bacterium]
MIINQDFVTHGDTVVDELPKAPMLINGRTMLPFRYLVENILGGNVIWHEADRSITATINESTIKMKIDELSYYINDEEFILDQAPVIVDNFTMLPLRAFESFVDEIFWYHEAKMVVIFP